MKDIVYKGKHSDICRDIAEKNRDSALSQIYAYMRSEENVDSYSIDVLTIIRQLLDEGASDQIETLKIRMRSSGDKVLINLAQFAHAFRMGRFNKEAEIICEKCASSFSKMKKSMQDYLEENGSSRATEMAGLRIREAMRIFSMLFIDMGMEDERNLCDTINLEMSKVFLGHKQNIISEDMMRAAKCEQRCGNFNDRDELCKQIIKNYGFIVETIKNSDDFQREQYETLEGVKFAYETLNENHEYDDVVKTIQDILSD